MEIIMDLHTHSIASIHAYSTITENAREGKKNGLQIMGMSDHGYGMPNTTNPDHWMNLKCLPEYLEGVRLLKGIEANIYNEDGMMIEEDVFHRVDYVIGSIHGNAYDYSSSDSDNYTKATINAIERNPQMNILGHPDDSRHPLNYKEVIPVAAAHGVAIEVNNSSLRPENARKNCEANMRTYLPLCVKYSCQIIINSDAHMLDAVGNFTLAKKLLNELCFPEELLVNTSWKKLENLLGKSL